jgi:adenylate kinase family enzyme
MLGNQREKNPSKTSLPRGVILTGYPKSGKTLYSHRLAKRHRLSHLSLDALIDAFERTFPEHGITHDAPTLHEVVDNLRRFVRTWIHRQLHYQVPFLLEGYHLDLEELYATFSSQEVRIICLGYPSLSGKQKLRLTRKYSKAPDWTIDMKDEEMETWFQRAALKSGALRVRCERLGVPFIDTGREFWKGYREVNRLIMSRSD